MRMKQINTQRPDNSESYINIGITDRRNYGYQRNF